MRKLKKNRTLVLTRTAGAVAKALLHDFVFVNHGGPGGWPPGYRSDERELKYSKIFTIFTACSGVLLLVHFGADLVRNFRQKSHVFGMFQMAAYDDDYDALAISAKIPVPVLTYRACFGMFEN